MPGESAVAGPAGNALAGGRPVRPGWDAEARRLLWRCRRGMKELDVLLERYVRLRLLDATEEERRMFARLLELPDPILADYLFGHATPEAPLAGVVAAIVTAASAPGSIESAVVGQYR